MNPREERTTAMLQTALSEPPPIGAAMPELITARQIQQLIPVSLETLRDWMERFGFPKPQTIVQRNYWRRDEVLAWLKEAPTMDGRKNLRPGRARSIAA